MKAGARREGRGEGTGQCVNLRTFLFPGRHSCVQNIGARSHRKVENSGQHHFCLADDVPPRSSIEVFASPERKVRQADSECGRVALNYPRRLSPISNSIGSLD